MLRSLAILLVLLSHCGFYFAFWSGGVLPDHLSAAGFFGVELFFVLSGFLIGRLLFQILEREVTPRAWLVFMVRRWMRTLPLYFICLALLAILWPPHFWEPAKSHPWRDLAYYGTLTQNLFWPMRDGWFSVTWSLTIEEWFYLLFSAALLGAAALIGRGKALWLSVAIFLVVPTILRWQLPPTVDWDEVTSKVVAYRLDAIAYGIVVAKLCQRRYPAAINLVCLAAGTALVLSVWTNALFVQAGIPQHARLTFIFTLTSIGFALCLPAAASWRQSSSRLLSRSAAAISAMSYAMYLTHLSVLEAVGYYRARLNFGTFGLALLCLGAIIGLSAFSAAFIERPILRRRPRQFRVCSDTMASPVR